MFGANCETFCLLMECLGKMFVDKSCLTFLNVMECLGEMFGANYEMFVWYWNVRAKCLVLTVKSLFGIGMFGRNVWCQL